MLRRSHLAVAGTSLPPRAQAIQPFVPPTRIGPGPACSTVDAVLRLHLHLATVFGGHQGPGADTPAR